MLKVFVIYLHLKLNFIKNINTLANRAKELMFEVTNSRNEIQLTIFATNWFSNDLRQTDHCLDENSSHKKENIQSERLDCRIPCYSLTCYSIRMVSTVLCLVLESLTSHPNKVDQNGRVSCSYSLGCSGDCSGNSCLKFRIFRLTIL